MKKRYKPKMVTKMLPSFLLGVVLLATILAHAPVLAQVSDYNPKGLRATTLEEVLALPDEEIDLATAIMILYKEWDPRFDPAGSLEEIDTMARELEARISPDDSPERVVVLINQYVFEEKTFSHLEPTVPDYGDLRDDFLPDVIANKKGACLGLSLFYLVLAERLGIPFYGVAAPEHVFVRYDDGQKRINVEVTDGGRGYEDSFYEKKYMPHSTYRDYRFYLRNLVKREVIGLFLSNLGSAYGGKGMLDEAIAEWRKAIEINSNYAKAHYNLAVAYYFTEEYNLAIEHYDKAIEPILSSWSS